MEDSIPLPIDTIPTPNPDALMFKLTEPLVDRGSFEFTRAQSDVPPLPGRLFTLDGVNQVLVTSRFVTVTKKAEYGWADLVPSLKGLIREHVASGDLAVGETQAVTNTATESELGQRIAQLIEDQVRPAVAMDGGDVQFVGLTDEMIVQLRLIGSCSSCPSALTTLHMGIETMLVEEFPEVQGVEQVG
ncbi:MAG: NifU family protein [Myxococcota bacterium]|nr:NifU family protein [Myxococcota bacterium]